MEYTNKYDLPSAMVNACEEDDGHKPEDGVYHVTELLKPTKAAALLRRHYSEISQDVSDCVWLIFGKAVHSLLEKSDMTGYAEYDLRVKLENGLTVVGRCDLYNEKECAIEDYKTATVWKYLFKDFDDWKLQGLQYAYMMQFQGHLVKKLRFHAIMKDWSAGERKRSLLLGKEYPEHPIWTWEYDVTAADVASIHDFMLERTSAEDKALKASSDDDIPECSPEERWNTGEKYAVMKDGRKTAIKVCATMEEAQAYIVANPSCAGAKVETRHGEDKRCNDYCLGCNFCAHYKENHKEEK